MQAQYQIPAQAQLQYVGVGRRFFATLVDALLYLIVLGAMAYLFGDAQASGGSFSLSLSGTPELVLNLIYALYFIVLEGLFGATIGKLLLGIRVVKVDGSRIGLGASFIRNVLRIIDSLPTAYLLGAILIWTSPQRQRLGDRAAKTVVVRR